MSAETPMTKLFLDAVHARLLELRRARGRFPKGSIDWKILNTQSAEAAVILGLLERLARAHGAA